MDGLIQSREAEEIAFYSVRRAFFRFFIREMKRLSVAAFIVVFISFSTFLFPFIPLTFSQEIKRLFLTFFLTR